MLCLSGRCQPRPKQGYVWREAKNCLFCIVRRVLPALRHRRRPGRGSSGAFTHDTQRFNFSPKYKRYARARTYIWSSSKCKFECAFSGEVGRTCCSSYRQHCCSSYKQLKQRVVKARNLLDAIGRYPNAQGAFTLIRSCSGWAKVLHSCRTVLLPLQAEGLSQADQDTRHSLGRLVGSPLSDDDWRVASIAVANSGLAARSALEHAPAAYPPAQELCTRIWPGFGEYDLPLLGLLFFPMQVFMALPALRPKRVDRGQGLSSPA